MSLLSKSFVITNTKGLHVRAATVLAKTASQFQSTVCVELRGEKANGKSVMNLLLLTASQGTSITVTINGSDAQNAMSAIQAVVEDGFGETS